MLEKGNSFHQETAKRQREKRQNGKATEEPKIRRTEEQPNNRRSEEPKNKSQKRNKGSFDFARYNCAQDDTFLFHSQSWRAPTGTGWVLTVARRSSLSQAKLSPSTARFRVFNKTTEKSWR